MVDHLVSVMPSILLESRVGQVKQRLIELVTPQLQNISGPQAANRATVLRQLESALDETGLQNMPEKAREQIIASALADLIGYGPLEWLLQDEQINEIMVNGPDLVFIEKNSELWETDIRFESENHVLQIIDRILMPLGRRVDADNPTADARLPDGSRVNIAIRPVAVNGPVITIRKFSRNKMTSQDLIGFGTLTQYMAKFLEACVVSRMNILISGNTSSGKSTMLNVLSTFIPEHERIITIEDAVELQMICRHVIQMETKLPNIDGGGAVSIRDLVRNALRMRPDRLVVGEVRGGGLSTCCKP